MRVRLGRWTGKNCHSCFRATAFLIQFRVSRQLAIANCINDSCIDDDWTTVRHVQLTIRGLRRSESNRIEEKERVSPQMVPDSVLSVRSTA